MGSLGVNVFFVLSGFLITRILLNAKRKNENENKSHFPSLKNFIVRRSLRIFPIYYLTVLIVYFTGGIQKSIWYFLTYTSNFYFYSIGKLKGGLAIAWTLAVEEQFYLFFPWIIFFVKRKYILPFLLLSILIGILFNPFFLKFFMRNFDFYIFINQAKLLTPACFDSLGLGALLGYSHFYKPKWENAFITLIKVFGGVALFLIVAKIGWHINISHIKPLCISLISLLIISSVVHIQKDKIFLDIILKNKCFIFLGRISYGLYLYHLLVGRYFVQITKNLDLAILKNVWIGFSMKFIFLVLVTTLSWLIIEKPILRLKKNFSY